MTDARRKAKIWLLKQKKTFADLASMAGVVEATIHNALNGRGSTKAKQSITNAVAVQLWDDIPVTERCISVAPGLSIEFPDVQLARECANEVGRKFAAQRGRTLTFTRRCTLAIQLLRPKSRPKEH